MKNKKFLNKIILITFIVVFFLISFSSTCFADMPLIDGQNYAKEVVTPGKYEQLIYAIDFIALLVFLIIYIFSALQAKKKTLEIDNNQKGIKIRLIPITFQIVWMTCHFSFILAGFSIHSSLMYLLAMISVCALLAIWIIAFLIKRKDISFTHKLSLMLLAITLIASIILENVYSK